MFTSTVCSTCSTEPSNLSRWCCAVRRYRLVMMPASLWNTIWKFKQWFIIFPDRHVPAGLRCCFALSWVLLTDGGNYVKLDGCFWGNQCIQWEHRKSGRWLGAHRADAARSTRSPLTGWETKRESERKRMMTGLRNEIWTTCGPTSINNGSRQQVVRVLVINTLT